MREILFRGKQIDIGGWVEGDLQHAPSGTVAISACNDFSMVDPETVGQYTGLNDRNGRKIFEGDIVDIPGSKRQGLPAEIYYSLVYGGFYIRRYGYRTISLEDINWYEVVGNIFDNPELISG